MKLLKELYPGKRFFYASGLMVLWFLCAYFLPALYLSGIIALFFFAGAVVYESFVLRKVHRQLEAERVVPVRLSLADSNKIRVELTNLSERNLNFMLIDELPEQLQIRDFLISGILKPGKTEILTYSIKPVSRGAYHFGALIVLVSTGRRLVYRRTVFSSQTTVPVFPSVIRLREFLYLQQSPLAGTYGLRSIRRIGHSYEFEQIRNYVRGDDIRKINWKATSRRSEVMVNLFREERSQPVYNIIDKGRNMLMPFDGLSLMDHAINATMLISGVVLDRQDMAGLITFSDKIGAAVRADRRNGQLANIAESLYNQREREKEPDFQLLYFAVRNMIKTRSLIFLYTNFESIHAFRRALPVLRKLAGSHLLMVVFFRNTEVAKAMKGKPSGPGEMYRQILATQSIQEKEIMALELRRLGIRSILCEPQQLSLAVFNSYREIKAGGMI